MDKKEPTTERLIELYLIQKMSLHGLAREFGLQRRTIARRLKLSGIELRRYNESIDLSRKNTSLSAETLRKLYWTDGLSSNSH